MAIDIGDAVLTFLGDTTQLDATFSRVGAEAPAKMAPAEAAIKSTGAATDDMAKSFAVGQQGAVELGTVVNLAGETSRESMYQARGEAGLLGEAFGIHLPRHVRSFIAELPGVGTALSAAFQATAVLFIIEALAKGIEKLIEWSQEAHKLELAQQDFSTAVLTSFNNLDDKLLRAGIKIDELRGDHLDALRKEIELINHQSLSELQHQFDLLSQAADAIFKQLATGWLSFDAGSKGAQSALTDFKSKYELLLAEGKDKEANDLLAGTLQSAKDTLAQMEKAKDLAEEVHKSIVHGTVIESKQGGGPGEKELQAQRDLVAVLDSQVKAREKINELASDDKSIKTTEEANRVAAEADRIFKSQAESEKRGIEEEDRAEDERRNEFIANLQQQEKEKIAATKQGSTERIQIIDAAIKEEEAHGLQDTAFYKSLETQKIQAVQARIAQQQAALNKANQDALKNDEQQAKRELEAVKESSSGQERAISDLGKFKLLTQSQTSKLLIASYEDEKNRALAVLQTLLNQERALMTRAAKELAEAKLNPGVTPEQIQQAETLLNQLKNAVANTETQISKVKSDANARMLALDKSYYGQALALAIAFGNQEVASRLKANHAALLSAQANLVDAKARGADTHAIEQQIKSLLRLEKELIKQSQAETKAHSRLLAEFAQTSKAIGAYEAELDASGQKTAAWGAGIGTVMAGVAEAYAQGGVSIEQALAKVAAAEINAIAQVAEKEGTKQLALALGSWPDGAAMAHHFAAAGLWFTLGAGLSAASGALSGGGGGGSSSASSHSGSAGPAAGSPNVTGSGAAAPVVNVVHLASGGLVDRPTLAVVGDAAGGGRSREAVLPLDNHDVMRSIAGAIAAHASASGQQEIHVVIHSDLVRTVQQINRGTKSGKLRLHSTSTDKTIRKT